MTWPITVADRPDLMELWTVHPDDFDPTVRGTMIKAPCCGRKTAADTVVSLEGLVTEIKGGNVRPKQDLDWACDGCLNILIADPTNGWTWSNLYNALGAPDDVLRHYVAQEAMKEAERDTNTRKEWFNPVETLEQIEEALPADMKSDLATQRPDATASK